MKELPLKKMCPLPHTQARLWIQTPTVSTHTFKKKKIRGGNYHDKTCIALITCDIMRVKNLHHKGAKTSAKRMERYWLCWTAFLRSQVLPDDQTCASDYSEHIFSTTGHSLSPKHANKENKIWFGHKLNRKKKLAAVSLLTRYQTDAKRC